MVIVINRTKRKDGALIRSPGLLVIQQLFMAERAESRTGGSEVVNNSAASEMIGVDKMVKVFVHLPLRWQKRAHTGPLPMSSDDRSTIVTILWSGAGRAFIRNESSR